MTYTPIYENTAQRTAICNSFVKKFWKLIEPVQKIENQFKTQLNELEVTLANMVFSTDNQIQQGLQDIENNAQQVIPGDTIDAVRDIKTIIDGCDCFESGESEQNAVSGVLGGLLGIYDQLDDYLGTIPYPEFTAGGVANTLKNILNGAGIGIPGGANIAELLLQADCLLGCMDSLCPATRASSEWTLMVDELDRLYQELKLDDNAEIKFDEIYTAAGITDAGIISNLDSVIDGIGTTQQDAATGIGNSVNAIKDAIKGGLF